MFKHCFGSETLNLDFCSCWGSVCVCPFLWKPGYTTGHFGANVYQRAVYLCIKEILLANLNTEVISPAEQKVFELKPKTNV